MILIVMVNMDHARCISSSLYLLSPHPRPKCFPAFRSFILAQQYAHDFSKFREGVSWLSRASYFKAFQWNAFRVQQYWQALKVRCEHEYGKYLKKMKERTKNTVLMIFLSFSAILTSILFSATANPQILSVCPARGRLLTTNATETDTMGLQNRIIENVCHYTH